MQSKCIILINIIPITQPKMKSLIHLLFELIFLCMVSIIFVHRSQLNKFLHPTFNIIEIHSFSFFNCWIWLIQIIFKSMYLFLTFRPQTIYIRLSTFKHNIHSFICHSIFLHIILNCKIQFIHRTKTFTKYKNITFVAISPILVWYLDLFILCTFTLIYAPFNVPK